MELKELERKYDISIDPQKDNTTVLRSRRSRKYICSLFKDCEPDYDSIDNDGTKEKAHGLHLINDHKGSDGPY